MSINLATENSKTRWGLLWDFKLKTSLQRRRRAGIKEGGGIQKEIMKTTD